jgi:hypothetical protein
LNSLFGISKKLCFHYDIGYNNGALAILCHVVYAALGITMQQQAKAPRIRWAGFTDGLLPMN